MIPNFTPNTEILIQYLDDELVPEDKLKLEEKLRIDTELRNELANLSLAIKTVKNFGLKERISGIHTEMMRELKPVQKAQVAGTRTILLRTAMKIAASFLLLILVYGVYTYLRLFPENIISSQVDPYTFRISRAPEVNELRQAYDQGEYTKVTTWVEQSKATGTIEKFLAANAYFGLHEYEKAAQYFNTLLLDQSSEQYADEAQYYLALCLLKLNKPADALSYLTTIRQNKKHRFHDKVTAGLIWKAKMLKNKI